MIKRNELSSYERTRRNIKRVSLSARSRSEKSTRSVTPATWHSRKDTAVEMEKDVQEPEFGVQG